MNRIGLKARALAAAVGIVAVPLAVVAGAGPAQATTGAQPFTTLASGLTQSLYATGTPIYGDVAFAPNGDPLVVSGSIVRLDSTTTTTVHGSTVHPIASVTSPAAPLFFGVVNGVGGVIYANTPSGIYTIDAAGNPIAGPAGTPGNGLGIAVDPQTGNVVYPDHNGNISWVSSDLASSGVLAVGSSADGIAFEPGGNFLFLAEFGSGINEYRRDGTFVQNIPNSASPDGMAFHGGTPQYLVSNNNDGSITRYDFAGNDFTTVPTQSVLASGGFRGDLSQVGSDGCLYVTQYGTRFDDGTTTTDGSIVQICPNFIPPVAADNDLGLTGMPANQTVNATRPAGATVTFTPPTATDEDTPVPAATCDHASGSTFPIGTTTVTCSTTDADDSPSTVSQHFTVTVKGAATQLQDLLTLVNGFPPGTSLPDKVRTAISYLEAGNVPATCSELSQIINEAKAQSGKHLTASQATAVIAAASRIRAVLGC